MALTAVHVHKFFSVCLTRNLMFYFITLVISKGWCLLSS